MKKIAVIFAGNIFNRKGLINSALEHIQYLNQSGVFEIDSYCIINFEPWYVRLIRNTPKYPKTESVTINQIPIKLIWRYYSLFDYLWMVRLKKKSFLNILFLNRQSKVFSNYDLISAHSIGGAELASTINSKYGIPFCVTWHGSDIHTAPLLSKNSFNTTKSLLENADANFFVSQKLMVLANSITNNINNGLVLYNGVSNNFYRYDYDKRVQLRNLYKLAPNTKVVAFVGNLFTIKNADLLPDIFYAIDNKYSDKLVYWIIGDGKLRTMVEEKLQHYQLTSKCIMWGNQPADKVPDIMNCIDVLILPSQNEGLPLVTVEALKCGVNVVGSNVGGIPEVIGEDNVFDLDKGFINNLSERVLFMLNHTVQQQLSPVFDWNRTAENEIAVYNKLLRSKR